MTQPIPDFDRPAPREPQTVGELLERLNPVPWVTPAIAGLIGLGFVYELMKGVSPASPTADTLLAVGANYGPAVADGQWWRLLTAMFLHAGVMHIAFNTWAFWSAGRFTERIYGSAAYLVIYLLAGLGGSLASLAVHPQIVSVGASGAIFGVYGALLAFVLTHRGVLPAEMLHRQRNSLLMFMGYNVVFGLMAKGIDMSAHAGGLVVGGIAGFALTRNLRKPHENVGGRVLGALAVAAGLAVAGYGVIEHLTEMPR
jgi:membrane associated rhomboid family serine protease